MRKIIFPISRPMGDHAGNPIPAISTILLPIERGSEKTVPTLQQRCVTRLTPAKIALKGRLLATREQPI